MFVCRPQEYHLRECPTRLFAVMIRAVTTAPVLATFIGALLV